MKYMKIAGPCLVALLLMSMAMAASASAGPVWEACEKAASGTKFTTSQCETASSSGEWAWAEIKGTEKSVSKGSVSLIQEKVPIVETVEVECTLKGEGSVGPAKYSRAEHTTFECKAGKNCEKLEKMVEAANLPWQEELYETESSVKSNISNGKTGKEGPGWRFTCKVLGAEDKAELSAESTVSTVQDRVTSMERLVLLDPRPGDLDGSWNSLRANGNGLRVS